MRVLRPVVLGIALLFGLFGSAYAQEASVIGTVTDETKAMLPGVTITATSLETGVQPVAVTDANGNTGCGYRPAPTSCRRDLRALARCCCRKWSCWSARTPPSRSC